MTNMWNYLMTLVSLMSKCNAIGVEYYDDNNLPEKQTEDIIPDVRRLGSDDILRNSSVWEHNFTDYLKSSITEKYNLFMSGDFGGENDQDPESHNVSNTMSTKSNVTILPLDNIMEYEYIYNDDDDVKQPLRADLLHVEHNNDTHLVGSNIKTSLTEFYNLEPALKYIGKFIVNADYNYTKCFKQWYVLEDRPCWSLPLLYGELGKPKKSSNVFLMHGGKLKNVVEKNGHFESLQSSQRISAGELYTTNKWCKAEPCYGDHTLCLFSEKSNYGLCDGHYKVTVPGILEQTALVNTLNSMRNKIANGKSVRYSHLPPAAYMKQIIYDYDLEKMAKVWLHQCLPGPAPCSALDEKFVTQLECTKYVKHCCVNSYKAKFIKCTPKPECFVNPVIGCLYVWFWKAGQNLTTTDVQCGHTSVQTYSTAQLIWATTYKIGCAYAQNSKGDDRIICNFSPGAPFALETRYYCGLVGIKNTTTLPDETDNADDNLLKSLGISLDREIVEKMKPQSSTKNETKLKVDSYSNREIFIISKLYSETWLRKVLEDYSNGTRGMIARLVLKYEFFEENEAKCDSHESIYTIGEPGSLCAERGRRYQGLCYDFREPTPGYRLVAILATMILFSLILCDLFSGIVRQTNNY